MYIEMQFFLSMSHATIQIKNGKPQMEPLLKQVTLMMPVERQERTSAVVRHCTAMGNKQ